MISVLGRENSINVQKVMWTATEIGCQVERTDIGGEFGGNESTKYLGLNPTGQIPTLLDGDYVLWESNAIVRYLSERYGSSPWQPKDQKLIYLGHQWMDFYSTALHPVMTTIFWQLVRTPEKDRDKKVISIAHEKAKKLWNIVNEHLSCNKFILGPKATFSDVPLGCAAYRWHKLDIERPNFNYLKSWFTRLSERPAYKKHVMLPLT